MEVIVISVILYIGTVIIATWFTAMLRLDGSIKHPKQANWKHAVMWVCYTFGWPFWLARAVVILMLQES